MNTTAIWLISTLAAVYHSPDRPSSLYPNKESCQNYMQIKGELTPRMNQAFVMRCPELIAGFSKNNLTLEVAGKQHISLP